MVFFGGSGGWSAFFVVCFLSGDAGLIRLVLDTSSPSFLSVPGGHCQQPMEGACGGGRWVSGKLICILLVPRPPTSCSDNVLSDKQAASRCLPGAGPACRARAVCSAWKSKDSPDQLNEPLIPPIPWQKVPGSEGASEPSTGALPPAEAPSPSLTINLVGLGRWSAGRSAHPGG